MFWAGPKQDNTKTKEEIMKKQIMKTCMIMVLAIFAISIVGCRPDDDKEETPKQACAKKAETHVWNEATKACDPKPAEGLSQQACVQDLTKKWDSSAKAGQGECKNLTQEECTLPTVTWDASQSKCVLKSESAEEDPAKYTVTLKSSLNNIPATQVKLTKQQTQANLWTLNTCVRLKESDFAGLKIATFQSENQVKVLCDSTENPPRAQVVGSCAPGHYSVVFNNSGNSNNIILRPEESANANIDDCKRLDN